MCRGRRSRARADKARRWKKGEGGRNHEKDKGGGRGVGVEEGTPTKSETKKRQDCSRSNYSTYSQNLKSLL